MKLKAIAPYLVGAVTLAALGGLCLGWSRLDRDMANAQQMLQVADYDAADASLQAVERYYDYVRRVPGVGDRAINDVRARRAAVAYWRGAFDTVLPAERTEPVADIPADNVALQLIVADAVYRNGQPRAKDRAATLRLLDSSISAYRTVLGNARRPEDASSAEVAAYNYEMVVRLRGEVVSNRRRTLPPPGTRAFGHQGKPQDPAFENEFKKYIPLEKEERDEAVPGKMPPPVRKG